MIDECGRKWHRGENLDEHLDEQDRIFFLEDEYRG
jgi:hypothetical protein